MIGRSEDAGTPTRSPGGVRPAVVAVSAVVAVVAAFIGSGAVVGTPIAQAAGGALSATATLVAPATGAFRIWSVIYVLLVALAVWQARPARVADPRLAALRGAIAASLLLNGAWILSVQLGSVLVSVPLIVALLAVLAWTVAKLLQSQPSSRVEAVLLDGTMGLYLGWVMVATIANIAAALVDQGVPAQGQGSVVAAAAVLVVAAALGAFVGSRGRVAPVLSFVWGLAWITVGRLDEPRSGTVAATAAVAAAITVLALLFAVTRRRGAPAPAMVS